MKARKIKRTTEICMLCIGYTIMGGMLFTLILGLSIAFCHLVGLDTTWANSIF